MARSGGEDVTAEQENDVFLNEEDEIESGVVCIGVCIDLVKIGL